nr:hypothetical protein [Tanacetum cinerariifolium]
MVDLVVLWCGVKGGVTLVCLGVQVRGIVVTWDSGFFGEDIQYKQNDEKIWKFGLQFVNFFQDFLNTSESSNDDSNVVNAPQEPIVFNQDPVKILYKVLHKLTTNVVTGVVIRYTVSSVSDVLVSLVGKIPICYDDDDDEESSTPLRDIIISELSSCIAITPVLSTKETKDSLIIGDEHLDTIPEKESDEFIKSSVKNLVPNLSEPKDLSNIGRIDSDYSDFEGENLFPERLLHDDPIPLPDILDFSNVIQFFSPLFTYPVTTSILLSFGSEDTLFDPGISDYHLSSLEPNVSH